MKQKKATAVYHANFSAAQVRARVNRFLLSQAGSQFCAGDPDPDVLGEQWRVPILLVTPGLVVGQVGEATVNLNTREIESYTSIKQIHAAADKLRKQSHAAIKTAFLQAGKR